MKLQFGELDATLLLSYQAIRAPQIADKKVRRAQYNNIGICNTTQLESFLKFVFKSQKGSQFSSQLHLLK